MKNPNYRVRRVIVTWLKPKAIIVGLATFNFALIYVEAKRAAGLPLCWGGPWYAFEQFSNYPLLLLIAASGLYLGRWWGNLAAVVLSTPVVYGGLRALLSGDGLLSSWYWHPASLLSQYVLAVAIFCYAVAAFGRLGVGRQYAKS